MMASLDVLWQDLRYTLRTLARAPTFTAAAVLSLALGVGANTTVFTVINALFLNPLPVHEPARLVAVNTLDTKNTTQFGNVMPLSHPNLVDLGDGSRAFSGLAGYSAPVLVALSTGGEPETVFTQLVTANYFDVARPATGGRSVLPRRGGPHAGHASGRRARATASGNGASAARRHRRPHASASTRSSSRSSAWRRAGSWASPRSWDRTRGCRR